MKRITALILAAAMIALTLAGCFEQSAFSAAPARLDLPDTGDVRMPFFASDNGYFYRRTSDGSGEKVYIKGVNMGLTEPQTDLKSPDTTYDTFMEWFRQIAAMNASTVRVFTVMNPKDLKTQYKRPLLIAEYGLSTSRGVAHIGINNYQQGGLNEDEQGWLNARMTADIREAGCCGGLLFSWQDEWFKRTWNIDMYYPDDPAMRTHDLSSAEQGYGLLGFDTSDIYPDGDASEWTQSIGVGESRVCVQYDADYMHLLVSLPKDFDFDNDTYYVPIQITAEGSKSAKDKDLEFTEPVDYLLEINGKENTRLLCDAYRDVFHYKYAVLRGIFGEDEKKPFEKNSGEYRPIQMLVSNEMYLPDEDVTIPPKSVETGLLRYGNANPASEDFDSLADFCLADNQLEIRLAWYLLGVKNPRTKACIAPLTGSEIDFTTFDGIRTGAGKSGKIELFNANFKGIDNLTQKPRLKKSYTHMTRAFAELYDKTKPSRN